MLTIHSNGESIDRNGWHSVVVSRALNSEVQGLSNPYGSVGQRRVIFPKTPGRASLVSFEVSVVFPENSVDSDSKL